MKMKRLVYLLGSAILLAVIYCAVTIWQYGKHTDIVKTDAAIVLGAAVYGEEPSPVFRERIHHAVQLYEQQQVNSIIFTGGRGDGDTVAESEVASYVYQQTSL